MRLAQSQFGNRFVMLPKKKLPRAIVIQTETNVPVPAQREIDTAGNHRRREQSNAIAIKNK
jgi:hypothetical protein